LKSCWYLLLIKFVGRHCGLWGVYEELGYIGLKRHDDFPDWTMAWGLAAAEDYFAWLFPLMQCAFPTIVSPLLS